MIDVREDLPNEHPLFRLAQPASCAKLNPPLFFLQPMQAGISISADVYTTNGINTTDRVETSQETTGQRPEPGPPRHPMYPH